MIIELGEYSYTQEHEAVNQLRSMFNMMEGEVEMYDGEGYKTFTYIEALESCLLEWSEWRVVYNLYPFTKDLKTLQKAFEHYVDEMLNTFEAQDIKALRIEAMERFGSDWFNVDERVDIHKAIINGEVRYFEMM